MVPSYNKGLRTGVNLGSYAHANGGAWKDEELAELAAALGIQTIRPALPGHFVESWGYDVRRTAFEEYARLDLDDLTAFIGFPSEEYRDKTEYCEGTESMTFKGLYEPIWDGGAEGTPVNEDNSYALYVYKLAREYGGLIRYWEVWNEPDFSPYPQAYYPASESDSWWNRDPDPCELTRFSAPIQHYIRMLRITYEVIKSIDPNDYIAVGGLGFESFLDAILRNTDNPDGGAITADFPLKGGAYFDALSYHYYPHLSNGFREWSNDIFDWVNQRHSDGAVTKMWDHEDRLKSVLANHGYDNQTYPEKRIIVTETNVAPFTEGMAYGGAEVSVNYALKVLVQGAQRGLDQVHFFQLGQERTSVASEWEMHKTMGLYHNLNQQNLNTALPMEQGTAVQTYNELMAGYGFDANATAELQLESEVSGAAFKNSRGDLMYVLWTPTKDLDESTAYNYTFPSSLIWHPETAQLLSYNWDYSLSRQESNTVGPSIQLSGSPLFIKVIPGTVNVADHLRSKPEVFPNPTKDELHILGLDTYSIQIMDSRGSIVLKDEVLQRKSIFVSNLPAGSYNLELRDRLGNVYREVFIKY